MRKKLLPFRLFVSALLVGSCQQPDSRLEWALALAKENRSELEQVLTFYANDSLKLEAAKFLIRNMPGHQSYKSDEVSHYYDAVDSALQVVHMRSIPEVADTLEEISFQLGADFRTIQDVEVVTADFLIENIEDAFRQWRQGCWSTHLSFQEFCEYLLPYKVMELQPQDKWRSYLKGRFGSNDLEKLKDCDLHRNSAIWAAHYVNDDMKKCLKAIIYPCNFRHICRLDTKLRMPFGVCQDYVEIATAVLRSEGIPVAIDFTPQWPYRSLGHSWNVLLALHGKILPFVGVQTDPGYPHMLGDKMAKVYRQTYAANPEMEDLLKSEECVPPAFRTLFIKDVTQEYMNPVDVKIRIGNIPEKYVYLAVFNDRDWAPVAIGKVNGHEAIFRNVGRDVLYLPVCYRNNCVEAIGNPFLLAADGQLQEIIPRKDTVQDVTLYRKFLLMPHVQASACLMIGGRFQASNSPDFKDAVTIHEVESMRVGSEELVLPPQMKPYRYWRYFQPSVSAHCCVAEIAFFESESHQMIHGKVMDAGGAYGDGPYASKEAVFDGDLLTYFDVPADSCSWIGMDFGHPVSLERITYTARGDGNTVAPGDKYELFFWDNGRWTSLGSQIAATTRLYFKDVPTNALLLLRNLSQGKEERIFLYKDGKQEFW